jgi:hypothetical protein
MKRLTICLAVTAALALPATAGAADKFYGGKIDNGGKIGIDATLQGGEPFQILAMRYANFPANCDGTPATIGGTWSFTNGFVVNNKFDLSGSDGGSQLFFKGEFKQGGRKIEGKIKEGPSEFPGGAICTSPKRNYDAKRGDNGPHPQPKAKIARAFRVAG